MCGARCQGRGLLQGREGQKAGGEWKREGPGLIVSVRRNHLRRVVVCSVCEGVFSVREHSLGRLETRYEELHRGNIAGWDSAERACLLRMLRQKEVPCADVALCGVTVAVEGV